MDFVTPGPGWTRPARGSAHLYAPGDDRRDHPVRHGVRRARAGNATARLSSGSSPPARYVPTSAATPTTSAAGGTIEGSRKTIAAAPPIDRAGGGVRARAQGTARIP